jgi:uncharacterized protein (TIGR03067 family)
MRGVLACVLLGVLAVGAASGGGKKYGDKFQGKWVGQWKGDKITLTLDKDKFIFDIDGKAEFKGTFKTDAKKKPMQMDLTVKEGPMFEGQTAKAIYQLDGDTLKWHAHNPGNDDRPKEFPKEEGDHLYVIFKRAK